jgi:hypothetical protein
MQSFALGHPSRAVDQFLRRLTSAVPLPEEGRHNVNVRHPIIKISIIASDGWLTKFWEASSTMVLSPANDRLRGADITLENPMLRRNQNAHKALD